MPSAKVKAIVDEKIKSKKVMMFSKTYCPFCKKAKQALEKYLGKELKEEDYGVMEIENDPDMDEIQDYLKELTGGRSVPRVYINEKFVGGGDDMVAMDKNGELKKKLS